MGMAKTPEEVVTTRQHAIYAARCRQQTLNIKAWRGGYPYIDARLHRAPNESDLSWFGASGNTDTAALTLAAGAGVGRKARAHLVNDAGRIVAKINQYLFAKEATRDGIDKVWAQDVTATGLTIGQFWQTASEHFTVAGWCWLGVDRMAPAVDPATGRVRERTLAEREAAGDRVHWSVWPATDIVDWRFDKDGNVLWLVAQDGEYDNADPFTDAVETKTRTLWRRGAGGAGATWVRYEAGEKPRLLAQGQISSARVPFIALGVPSALPWWFDDVEGIQAALLNLTSLHHENLVKSVYPQLVIPEGAFRNLQTRLMERVGAENGERVTQLIRELVRGLDHPFVESVDDKGTTRYLQPSAADLEAIPQQQERLRRQLFDMVGLALFNRESRQVQSAESKQFDHLDTAATLRNRALLMQEAEAKLVALTTEVDNAFNTYSPAWPTDFDVPNTSEDVASLIQLANFAELTPGMRKRLNKTALRLMDQIDTIPDEERTELLEEIEASAAAVAAGMGDFTLGAEFTQQPTEQPGVS